MAWLLRKNLVGALLVGMTVGVAWAQDGAAAPAGTGSSTVEAELQALSSQAGVIFAGEVLAVRPSGSLGVGAGWVEVEFRVLEAVRGCVGQGTYVLREWAGLWAGGLQRYRVGQQLLMLLHAPGASGLSSPVGGQEGVIPISGSGDAPRPEDGFTGEGDRAVDLRWVQARVMQKETGLGRGHARAAASAPRLLAGRERRTVGMRRSQGEGVVEAASLEGEVNGGPVAGAPLRSVLAMLGAWETGHAHVSR